MYTRDLFMKKELTDFIIDTVAFHNTFLRLEHGEGPGGSMS